MAIAERPELNKLAARRLIQPMLERAGRRHGEIAATLVLSAGAFARKLGPRYPDRFTPQELSTLAGLLRLSTEEHDDLRRYYGYGDGAVAARAADARAVGEDTEADAPT